MGGSVGGGAVACERLPRAAQLVALAARKGAEIEPNARPLLGGRAESSPAAARLAPPPMGQRAMRTQDARQRPRRGFPGLGALGERKQATLT